MNPEEGPISHAAERGVPSLVWRAGQARRLNMIFESAGERINGQVLVDGCGVGAYLRRLANEHNQTVGLDIEFDRLKETHLQSPLVTCGAAEKLPFADDSFDLALSHEVIEHVQDDAQAIAEIARVLKPGGRLVLFCPNAGYPFETHGIYWKGRYHFGNIPLVNYLPARLRNRLAPHVRVYSREKLSQLFEGLPFVFVQKTIIFGAYDNIIARFGPLGTALRSILQALEKSPLKIFGLSHFWVAEKMKSG